MKHGGHRRLQVQGSPCANGQKTFFCESDVLSSPMTARWPDGDTHVLSELLLSQWNTISESVATRRAGKKFPFDCTREHNGNRVHVAFRQEKPGSEMWGVYDNNKQVTMVLVHRFGAGDAASEKAKGLAVELAAHWVKTDMSKAQLISMRDEKLPEKAKKTHSKAKGKGKGRGSTPTSSSTGAASSSHVYTGMGNVAYDEIDIALEEGV